MTIGAHPQRNHIKSGDLRAFQTKALPNVKFVSGRGFFGIELALDTKDLGLAQGHLVQQGLAGHAVVAIRVVGGNTAFVDPIEFEVFPGNLLPVLGAGVGQERKRILRSVPAGDGDARLASRPRSGANTVDKVLRCAPGYRIRARIHIIENFDRFSHATRLPVSFSA